MMKTSITSISNGRSISNSQEKGKLVKSLSSTYHTKSKPLPQSNPNAIVYSVKQSRIKTSSQSNKKNNLSCHSNKSLKTLAESNSRLNFDTNKKQSRRADQPPATQSKPTPAVNVKNMKQRAIGRGLNESIQQPYKAVKHPFGKENTHQDYMKKSKKSEKDLFLPLKESKPQRDTCSESLLDFSVVLGNRQELNLNQFQVGRKLGKGRFGDVFMARDTRTGFAVAIKMISKKEVKDAGMENQVTQQIKIQMFSNHPNVLKMYGFFHDDRKIYLLLELATHGCLFKQIRKRGRLEQNMASFYFRQVASGVRYLHSNYIIHRDIKPENILNCFNVLKLCDFGWAAYSPLYQRQTFCGTLDYVPPEIVTGQFYDDKADVWCLGVLCYQLCTGRAPFESRSDQNETYERILKVNIDFPIYLSPMIVDFIGNILTRDPSKRMDLTDVQSHQWMRRYQNQPGRMICKQIWDGWMRLGTTTA